jgi:AcrR family transcriptional regulator
MRTPWGDSEGLRRRRLPPRPHPDGAAAVAAHQRRRLFAAMVASVAERGYEKTRIEDVAHRAGVARRRAYELFPPSPKRECFLAAVDELHKGGIDRVAAAYGAGGEWEARLRAGLTALLELIADQPAAAHACLVDAYEAGASGVARVEAGVAMFEGLMRESFAACPRRAALPGEVIEATVGALNMVIHDRVRLGRAAELPGMADDMLSWVLSYEAPPRPLALNRAAAPEGRGGASVTPRERLLAAMTEAVAEHGYAATTTRELCARAHGSLATLYEEFGGKEGLFLATFDTICARSFEVCLEAYRGNEEWPQKMHAVNHRLFDYLGSEPGFARTVLVDVLGAGPAALEHRAAALEPFRQLLTEGYALEPEAPGLAAEAIVYAVYSLAGRQVARGGPAALPRLAPTATFLEAAPFIGARRAVLVANSVPHGCEPGREARAASETVAG